MTTRRSASNVKVLHSGYTFTGSKSFPSGILPTKCQVLERIIQFENFRTVDVANDVAKEIHCPPSKVFYPPSENFQSLC